MKIDPKTTATGDISRLMIRTILPRPIAWVSTVSSEGVRNIAPFSFFMGITSEPPSLCFAPARRPGGAAKDTLANIEATGEFVVNVVTEELAEAMNETATDYPPEVDEFERAGLTPLASERVAAPRIAESPVHMECKLVQIVPVGTAGVVVVIGEIVLFHIDERVLREGKVDSSLLRAVGRMGGMEYAKTQDHFILKRKKFGRDVH
jgi:flavin reductase (DIM6/NTAB) family NADH-FMN oxidoreductase RutF